MKIVHSVPRRPDDLSHYRAGDSNIYFVKTAGWIGAGDYSADGGHPNDQGQRKIAAKLAPIIAKVLGIPAN